MTILLWKYLIKKNFEDWYPHMYYLRSSFSCLFIKIVMNSDIRRVWIFPQWPYQFLKNLNALWLIVCREYNQILFKWVEIWYTTDYARKIILNISIAFLTSLGGKGREIWYHPLQNWSLYQNKIIHCCRCILPKETLFFLFWNSQVTLITVYDKLKDSFC